jgi:hypothetical protein
LADEFPAACLGDPAYLQVVGLVPVERHGGERKL